MSRGGGDEGINNRRKEERKEGRSNGADKDTSLLFAMAITKSGTTSGQSRQKQNETD